MTMYPQAYFLPNTVEMHEARALQFRRESFHPQRLKAMPVRPAHGGYPTPRRMSALGSHARFGVEEVQAERAKLVGVPGA
jgi:hypothetical protein